MQAVLALARSLKDEGLGQVALYVLFQTQLQQTDDEGMRYDALTDTMDLIWGGGWAKGQALFNEELSQERLRCE